MAGSGTTINELRFVGREGYLYSADLANHFLRERWLMSSIGRFTSWDPLWPYPGSAVWVYAQNSPLQLIDPGGTLTIRPRTPKATDRDCGANARCDWIFELDAAVGKPDPKSTKIIGYIVQKVVVYCDIQNCSCSCPDKAPEGSTATYFEAWPVDQGMKRPIAPKGWGGVTDRAVYQCSPLKCGVVKQVGEVRFYRIEDTGDLGSIGNASKDGKWRPEQSFGAGDCATTSGQLPAIAGPAEPSFWGKDSAEKAKTREYVLTFNCCKGVNLCHATCDPGK